MIFELNAAASVVIALLCVWVLLSDRVRTGSFEIVAIGLIFMGTVINIGEVLFEPSQVCVEPSVTLVVAGVALYGLSLLGRALFGSKLRKFIHRYGANHD